MRWKITILVSFVFVAMLFSSSAYAADLVEPYYLIEVTGTNFLPAVIYAGDAVSVAVSIKNDATAMAITDLNASLDLGKEFEPLDLDDSISVIEAGSTKTLIFKFLVKQDTLPGYYPALLTINYLRYGRLVTEKEDITIPVSKASKYLDIFVSPKIINPGMQTDLVFSIKNLSEIPISNISFSWAESSNLILPLGSDNRRYSSLLPAGEQQDFIYSVAADVGITPGIYPIDITVSFTDVNGIRTQTSEIGIIAGGGTDFEVAAELSSSNQLSLSIANIGSNNASAVVVKIPQQQGLLVTGSNIAILGSLNKGDYTMANFQVSLISSDFNARTRSSGENLEFPQAVSSERQANRNPDNNVGSGSSGSFFQMPGGKKLTVNIDYTDTTGIRQTVSKTVNISSSSSILTSSINSFRNSSSARSSYNDLLLPLGLFALIVAGAAFFNKRHAVKSWKILGVIVVASALFFATAIFLFASSTIACLLAAVASATLFYWFFNESKVPVLGKYFSGKRAEK